MAGQKESKSLPDSSEVIKTTNDPAALVVLGDAAIQHVLVNPYRYETKWFDRLWKAVANLKDAIDEGSGIRSSASELALLLLHPEKVSRPLTKAEIAEVVEPTEDDIEAWAWGHDLAMTSKWFVALVLLAVLAILSYAVITFGLDSPNNVTIIIFLSLGTILLAAATTLLGIGLYQLYVTRGHISWEYKGYPNAEIVRSKKFYKTWGWCSYSFGGFFIASSITLALAISQQLLSDVVPVSSHLRLAFLSSTAIGLILFGIGVWPLIRNIVSTSEIDKRMGRAKYLASPRLLVALLPILTGTTSLIISWLFR